MALLMIMVVLAVPVAGLAVWRLFARTGHRGATSVMLGVLALFSFLTALATILSLVFGALGEALIMAPFLLILTAVLITGCAIWLAMKPWPKREA